MRCSFNTEAYSPARVHPAHVIPTRPGTRHHSPPKHRPELKIRSSAEKEPAIPMATQESPYCLLAHSILHRKQQQPKRPQRRHIRLGKLKAFYPAGHNVWKNHEISRGSVPLHQLQKTRIVKRHPRLMTGPRAVVDCKMETFRRVRIRRREQNSPPRFPQGIKILARPGVRRVTEHLAAAAFEGRKISGNDFDGNTRAARDC